MLRHGAIILVANARVTRYGKGDSTCALTTTSKAHDTHLYTDVVLSGSVSADEAYVGGNWSASDLTALVRILCRSIARSWMG